MTLHDPWLKATVFCAKSSTCRANLNETFFVVGGLGNKTLTFCSSTQDNFRSAEKMLVVVWQVTALLSFDCPIAAQDWCWLGLEGVSSAQPALEIECSQLLRIGILLNEGGLRREFLKLSLSVISFSACFEDVDHAQWGVHFLYRD